MCVQRADGSGQGHTIVHGLKVVDEGEDVAVTDRDSFENSDLISHLGILSQPGSALQRGGEAHHVFSTSHKALIDDYRGQSMGVDGVARTYLWQHSISLCRCVRIL